MKTKAFTFIGVLAVVAVIGLLGTFFAPKLFNGDSRRANQSQQATTELLSAQKAKESSVAASVATIGEANSEAPDSPQKDFIAREVPLVLSQLSPADAQKLYDAQQRKLAVVQGQLELANKLYGKASKDAADLVRKLAEAEEQRKQADLAISEAAAYKLGAERTKMAMGAVIAVLLLVAGYLKFYGISLSSAGKIVADVRAGVPAIQAFDTHLAPWLHTGVNKHSRLNTPTS